MDLPSLPLVVFDTETTGFVPRVHRVIEFASARVRGGEMEDEYEQLLSIPGEIPPHVQVLTRIKPEALEGKPTMDDVREAIRQHIGEGTLIVGQNVGFDIRMMKGEGVDVTDRPWIDTSMLASLVFPESESYSLGYISSALDLPHEPVHRALGDVRATLALLEKCWQRLLELPAAERAIIDELLPRMPEGYRQFFGALPPSTATERPTWLVKPPAGHTRPAQSSAQQFEPAETGTVHLLEEPLDPGYMGGLLDSLVADDRHTHWLAVKNLNATLRCIDLPEGVTPLYAPSYLLDTVAAETLKTQEQFSADETTLAIKLDWYRPQRSDDLPLHGDEKAIWNGKLACTVDSEAYQAQFAKPASVYLLTHWHLLTILADPKHPARAALNEKAHVLIDDASMLEDTATKAYGWYCALDDLRAAAEGHEELTKFTDLLQLWIEKTRHAQDVRYLTSPDLRSPEGRGLHGQLTLLLEKGLFQAGDPIYHQLQDLHTLLDAENLAGRIAWLEQRQNGSQFLQSVPHDLGPFLEDHLYSQHPTSLLIPPGSSQNLHEVLPRGTVTQLVPAPADTSAPALSFSEQTCEDILQNPPEGKSVLLLTSRGRIEQQYIQHAERLEQEGVTLICQGLSGGQSRMQAEFAIAQGKTLWLITPWSFEGVDLPPETIDHLFLDCLPFDHPSHTVLSRRAERYQNAFGEYSLPRLQHRLYRLLRTFSRYRTPAGAVEVLDPRIRTKRYGPAIREYLELLTADAERPAPPSGDTKGQLQLF